MTTPDASLFTPPSQQDVLYDKILELESRLVIATKAGHVKWERLGDSYSYNSPGAVVDVSPAGVKIYDGRGRELRRFRYETDTLYEVAAGWFEAMATDTLDRIMADLEAL